MPMTGHGLPRVVGAAWRETRQQPTADNRGRSATWVHALGRQFQAEYPQECGYRVFWRTNPCNRAFRLNEFLFDIAVCSVSHAPSLQRVPTSLEYVTSCHWQVESEFAFNTREILVDLSKLVLGAAANKLFVASHREPAVEQALLARCERVARHCGRSVFLVFIAHPSRWGQTVREPDLYELVDGGWRPLGDSGP